MAFIELNKAHFFHNLTLFAKKAGSKNRVAMVLKDNAYGHGLEPMAKLASEYGITIAVVRNVREAEEIKALFEECIILGGVFEVDEKYTYTINALSELESAPKGLRVELKVDTGMHRNGIALSQLNEALALVKKQNLQLVGVMTHFACADELGSELFYQQQNFNGVKEMVKKSGATNVRFHSQNSAATLRMTRTKEDLVRVGIGAYGYSELPEAYGDSLLKPVMRLYAKRVSTRALQKGSRVGYGGEYIAGKSMEVSTYDLGYGDGWRRGDASTPYVTAEGLPLLGRVSMDFISLEGSQEVVCIMNDAKRAAKHFKTISYEMTTALHPNIERQVI